MNAEISAAARTAVNAEPRVKDRAYALDPSDKARRMSPLAGPLKRCLSDRGLDALVAAYDASDQAALDAQKRYRRLERFQLWARYGMIVRGILALAFAQGLRPWLGANLGAVLGIAMVLQLVLFLAALVVGLIIRVTHPFETWMRLRSLAEVKRLGFFERVMRAQERPLAGELPTMALKLEFFRAYLLEPQLHYFQRRARELARGTGLSTFSLLVLVAIILYTIVQLGLAIVALFKLYPLPFAIDPELAMGRSLTGSAFAVLLASTTLSRVDERNALRYRQTADNLQALSGAPLLAAQAAAARADGEREVLAFAARVIQQVGFDAADWLSLEELAQSQGAVADGV